jgi:hypothetical protein
MEIGRDWSSKPQAKGLRAPGTGRGRKAPPTTFQHWNFALKSWGTVNCCQFCGPWLSGPGPSGKKVEHG